MTGAGHTSFLGLLFQSGVGHRPQHLLQWPAGLDTVCLVPNQRQTELQAQHLPRAPCEEKKEEEDQPLAASAGKCSAPLATPWWFKAYSPVTSWALACAHLLVFVVDWSEEDGKLVLERESRMTARQNLMEFILAVCFPLGVSHKANPQTPTASMTSSCWPHLDFLKLHSHFLTSYFHTQ